MGSQITKEDESGNGMEGKEESKGVEKNEPL